jgi:hypothetical protein
VDKGVIIDTLNRLESHLQALFEGGPARLLPTDRRQQWLAGLVAAMQAGIKEGDDGILFAPDLFTLLLSSEDARELDGNQAFLDGLTASIERAGLEAGLRFQAKPRIILNGNPPLSAGQFQVLTQVSALSIEETSTIGVSLDQECEPVPEGAFLILSDSQIYPLTRPVINMGRRAGNHLVLEDPRVSREHAQLRASRGRFVLFDLESSGGTFVNGSRIRQASLFPGDVISLAGVTLVFGQEAEFAAGQGSGVTQPLVPFPPQS